MGALRYFLLKFQRTKMITFDMDEALAFTGETGPYIQNGVVRARNIFAKLSGRGAQPGRRSSRARARSTWMACWRARRATRSGRCCC